MLFDKTHQQVLGVGAHINWRAREREGKLGSQSV